MSIEQGYLLHTVRTAQGFLDANAKEVDENGIASARRNLDDAVVQLAAHGETQNGSEPRLFALGRDWARGEGHRGRVARRAGGGRRLGVLASPAQPSYSRPRDLSRVG